MRVAAVVFDLDGTLLNSLEDIAEAANTILESHGFPTHDVSAYRYFVGDGLRRLLQRTVPEPCRDDVPLIERMTAEFTELYQRTWNIQSHLYEGVPDMLQQLAKRDIAMAVLSNKPQEATKRCVDYFLSGHRFAAVLGQQENRPPKPDPTGVREILQALKVNPHDCLYLGDTAVDMQTARGVAMTPVGASWGFRERDELARAGAKVIIDHPRELLELVNRAEGRT
jgi:phosphoglycolate phosphatase